MILLALLCIGVIANWRGMSGLFPSALSLIPLIIVGVPLFRKHRIRKPGLMAVWFLVLSVAAFGLANLDKGTLLHGDDHPALWFAATALGAAVVALVTPPGARGAQISGQNARAARRLALALPMIAIALWVGLAMFITQNAQTVFPEGARVCLRAPTGSQAANALGIAPGEFRATDWRGMTRPWLLAGTRSAGWSHHWSFSERRFVANETGAFTILTPGMKSPTTPAC